MRRLLLLAAFVAAACGTQSAAAPSPSPSTWPAPPTGSPPPPAVNRYAVIDTAVASGAAGQVEILSPTGQVVASAQRRSRVQITSGSTGGAVAPELPYESASDSLVYYLDGDSALKSLAPSGNTADIATLPGSARVHVAFAVSPDGARIAVSVIDYSGATPRLTLYVADLRGGNRTDLFASTGIYVWPVGWHAGDLVVAVGPAFVQQGAENPYTAFAGYHLVDPANGTRLAVLCADGAPIGPLTPAGTLCSSGGGLKVSGYDGRSRAIAKASGPACLALSPDGTRVACGPDPITLVGVDGSSAKTKAGGFAQGWIDDRSLVFAATPAGPGLSPLSVLDLRSGTVLSTAATGTFVGTLPGGL